MHPGAIPLDLGAEGIAGYGMGAKLHLMKLSVGTESVDGLAAWQAGLAERNRAAGIGPYPTHVTRMWPRREAEILDGGSIYWVIKGVVLCRQRIERFDERFGADGIRRCALVLDPRLYRTTAQPRRAFQGWRYLDPENAPADRGPYRPGAEDLPDAMAAELSAFGVL